MMDSVYTRRRERGFTLIELLVVMAITVILLGLIFGPMVQGFNLTNRARVQVLAQDTARRVMEIGQRDLANGVFVFDNAGQPINFWLTGRTNPTDPNSAKVVLPVLIPFSYVDLVPPARYVDQDASVSQNDLDPTTGLPVERSASADARFNIALPLAPGRVIIRYFLGLRDNTSDPDPSGSTSGMPRKPYANFYENTRNLQLNDHNPFVLYRAVISPYTPAGNVDTRLFHTYPNGDPRAGQPILYDPNFFYDASDAAKPADLPDARVPGWKDLNGDGQPQMFENWRAVSRALVPTDRADEVVQERDDDGQMLFTAYTYSGNTYGVPKLTPLVRFSPTYVGNDAGTPANPEGDPANEMPNRALASQSNADLLNLAPSAEVQTYGHWTFPFNIYLFRSDMSASNLRYFYWPASGPVMYYGPDEPGGISTGFDPNSLDPRRLPSAGYPYRKPFLDLTKLVDTLPQVLFTVDERRGVLNFTFPEWIARHDTQGNPLPATADPEPLEYSPAAVNAGWVNDTAEYRYLSLLQYPNGTENPLFKMWTWNRAGDTQIKSMRIVPGSEVVKGPDQRSGPNYGKEITYTRVPRNSTRPLGPNEYRINYVDLPPPPLGTNPTQAELDQLRAGTVLFDSADDAGNPPGPGRHALPVNSYAADGSLTDPAAPITITYDVQNNLFTDVVKADYLTRQLMSFSLGVRLYDFNSGQPQQVTLTQKVKVRNLQR